MGSMQEPGESFVGKGTGGLGELASQKDKGASRLQTDLISFESPAQMYDLICFWHSSVGEAVLDSLELHLAAQRRTYPGGLIGE